MCNIKLFMLLSKPLYWYYLVYSVSKTNCAANQIAHNLARLGRVDSDVCVLLGAVSPCVVDLANRECTESCME